MCAGYDVLGEKIGYAQTAGVVVPNGVDTQAFHPDPIKRIAKRAELGLSIGDIAVGLFARFALQKDIPGSLAAFSLFAAQSPLHRSDARASARGRDRQSQGAGAGSTAAQPIAALHGAGAAVAGLTFGAFKIDRHDSDCRLTPACRGCRLCGDCASASMPVNHSSHKTAQVQ